MSARPLITSVNRPASTWLGHTDVNAEQDTDCRETRKAAKVYFGLRPSNLQLLQGKLNLYVLPVSPTGNSAKLPC